MDELSRLKQLTFFAFDRFDMNAATYSDTLALMGKSCRSLEESVAITRDVSEGTSLPLLPSVPQLTRDNEQAQQDISRGTSETTRG